MYLQLGTRICADCLRVRTGASNPPRITRSTGESTLHFQVHEANGQGGGVEGGGCLTKGIVGSGVAWMGGVTGHSTLGSSSLSTWSSSSEEEVGDAVQGSGGAAGM